jgi:hypothetical protein
MAEMSSGIIIITPNAIDLSGSLSALITTAGKRGAWRFLDFFTATIRNPHTSGATLATTLFT